MTGTKREVAIVVVDAFTTVPFSGNPAAVVLEPGDLSDAAMQAIAREMNLSETAFLLPATSGDADLRVRWFTPASEIDLCGHATVATFHAAVESGRLDPGAYRMECRSGILPIEVRREGTGSAIVTMGLPVPVLRGMEQGAEELLAALRLHRRQLAAGLPLMIAGDCWLLPMADLAALHAVTPDFTALADLVIAQRHGNAILLTTKTIEPDSAVHVRMFAPAFGINEDPVTGMAQGPVAAYLAANGLLGGGADGATIYKAEQGDVLSRSGRITTTVTRRAGAVAAIRITGRAVTVLRGTIRI